jgi:hypothetical protein
MTYVLNGARPSPVFVVDSSDLSTGVVAELKVLDSPQTILKQAVGRIFENVDELQYHMAIVRFDVISYDRQINR